MKECFSSLCCRVFLPSVTGLIHLSVMSPALPSEVVVGIPSSTCVKSAVLVAMSAASLCAADYEQDIRPILQRHCFRCHGPEESNGDVRLDTLSTDLIADSAAAETWHDVLNVLNLGEMPPRDEPPLTGTSREVLADWLTEKIQQAVKARRSTGGKVTIRRLNRIEYRNTMRDLLGLPLDFGRNLPPDPPGADGFTNNGVALRMSPQQLESYLESARSAMRHTIVTAGEPDVAAVSQTESVSDKRKRHYTGTLGRSGEFVLRSREFPDEGEFVIRVRARAVLPAKSPYPRLRVVMGYRADTQNPSAEVGVQEIPDTEFQDYEFRGRIEEFPRQSRTQSKFPGLLVWLTNSYSDGKPPLKPRQETVEVVDGNGRRKKQKRTVYPVDPTFPQVEIESVSFTAPVYESWPPGHHTRVLFPDALSGTDPVAYARKVIARFMRRAFRRPVTETEIDSMQEFYQEIRPECGSVEEAMRETLAMILISPEFLYLVEPSDEGRRRLTDHELASRLSYFLWSTMPDEQLFRQADAGALSSQKTLALEVERLLKDPRAWNFIEQFSDQWLDLPGINRVAVNPEFYPGFTNALKPHMRKETQHFFAEVLQKDISALAFLDSDFAMLNQPLAEHYGLSGPRGLTFERVALNPDGLRGGLLTQASVLMSNSTGEDSHPIKRGVWIRERLLDDPPAPPPPDVPNLNRQNSDFASLPVKEQLVAHRENEACARCHRAIDPWGIALEEFDATGLFRKQSRRKDGRRMVTYEIDAAATLPDGSRVQGLKELKKYLLSEKRERFARAVVTRLLTYALGRSLELTDYETVDRLQAELIRSDFQLRKLIHSITASEAFSTK